MTGTESFLSISGGLSWALKRKMLTKMFTKSNQQKLFVELRQITNQYMSEVKSRSEDGQDIAYNMEIVSTAKEIIILK